MCIKIFNPTRRQPFYGPYIQDHLGELLGLLEMIGPINPSIITVLLSTPKQSSVVSIYYKTVNLPYLTANSSHPP